MQASEESTIRTHPRQSRADELIQGSGERGSRLVQQCLTYIAKERRLTPTLERRLIEVAAGLSYKEIAGKNGISQNTVKTEVRILLQSIGVTCRHEIEDALRAADTRAEKGASGREICDFLRLRFE